MSKGLIIAIDGPAGSGKSTSAKLIAQKLGYVYIDTGAMYRAITYLALQNRVIGDEKKIIELGRNCQIDLRYEDGKVIVLLNDEDVSQQIRSAEVNSHVSDVSKISEIRKLMVLKQREMGEKGNGIVMEGRDIGTVVFQNADVKIFLTASLDIRANRRTKEFIANGSEILVDEVKNNLSSRDKIDSSRNDSPLIKAADAVEVDTTNLTIEEQVNQIINEVKEVALKKNIQLKIKN